MSNQLNMADHQAILGLARLNWSQRRVAAELGIDRQTVSRHLKAPAIHPHPRIGRVARDPCDPDLSASDVDEEQTVNSNK
jgi:hypothetical protein